GVSLIYFFFQAEDGIRDFHVTGVQTCALPISAALLLAGCTGNTPEEVEDTSTGNGDTGSATTQQASSNNDEVGETVTIGFSAPRSEERRVGKEGRSRAWAKH